MKTVQKTLYAVIACLIAISLTSCKKTQTPKPFDNDPRATQTLKYLTQALWKETKLEYKTRDGTWISFPIPAADLGLSMYSRQMCL